MQRPSDTDPVLLDRAQDDTYRVNKRVSQNVVLGFLNHHWQRHRSRAIGSIAMKKCAAGKTCAGLKGFFQERLLSPTPHSARSGRNRLFSTRHSMAVLGHGRRALQLHRLVRTRDFKRWRWQRSLQRLPFVLGGRHGTRQNSGQISHDRSESLFLLASSLWSPICGVSCLRRRTSCANMLCRPDEAPLCKSS